MVTIVLVATALAPRGDTAPIPESTAPAKPARPAETAVPPDPAGAQEPEPEPSLPAPELPAATTPAPAQPTPVFDRAQLSIDDPASPWVVVNKLRPLQPREYRPADLVRVPVPHTNPVSLRAEASAAVVAMFDAFTAETGMSLQSLSAYRSYSTQVAVYNGHVRNRGQAYADVSSARPGHSEHQTGLSLDIGSLPAVCAFQACFGETAHGRWLAENAWRFGFVLRYPADLTSITGYKYEPWHVRYVGPPLASEMRTTGTATLEEFFGLPPAPDYAD